MRINKNMNTSVVTHTCRTCRIQTKSVSKVGECSTCNVETARKIALCDSVDANIVRGGFMSLEGN